MNNRYRLKNVFCVNTKLSEDEFTTLIYDYCSFLPASECAKKIRRSRQTVQGIFSKLGERLTYLFETNDFPNFSSSVAIEMMDDEKVLRTVLSYWIKPKIYDLALIFSYEELPEKGRSQNSVVVQKLDNRYIVRIFDPDGQVIDYNNIPADLNAEFENAFRNPPMDCISKKNIVERIISRLEYTQSKIRIYDELVPKFGYEAYLDYRNRGAVLYPDSNTVYHSRYRILNNMLRTEKALRGFSGEKFSNYLSRARLLELMMFMCSWAQRKYNLLKDKETKHYARDAAFMLIMLSLRNKPLSLK